MALWDNGSLLKQSAKFTLWGLGIYIGLQVAAPLLIRVAKPLAKEAERGCQSLRNRLKRLKDGEPETGQAEEEVEISGEAAAAATSVRESALTAAATRAVPEPASSSAQSTGAAKPKRQRTTPPRSGKPSAKWSKAQLYAKAKEMKVAGRSTMNKDELLAALKAAGTPQTA